MVIIQIIEVKAIEKSGIIEIAMMKDISFYAFFFRCLVAFGVYIVAQTVVYMALFTKKRSYPYFFGAIAVFAIVLGIVVATALRFKANSEFRGWGFALCAAFFVSLVFVNCLMADFARKFFAKHEKEAKENTIDITAETDTGKAQ
jgi:hypothetical protein